MKRIKSTSLPGWWVIGADEEQEIADARLAKKANENAVNTIFKWMSIIGAIDFADLGAVFALKTFRPDIFLTYLPPLLIETGTAAAFTMVAFWLIAHFHRHPSGHPRAGEMQEKYFWNAARVSIGMSLICIAVFGGAYFPSIAAYSSVLFAGSLINGSLHNIRRAREYKNEYFSPNCDPKLKNDLARDIHTHSVIGLALSLSAAGAIGANFLAIPLAGVLPIMGAVIGASFCASNLGIFPRFFKPAERLAYRVLGLGAALEETQEAALTNTHQDMNKRMNESPDGTTPTQRRRRSNKIRPPAQNDTASNCHETQASVRKPSSVDASTEKTNAPRP